MRINRKHIRIALICVLSITLFSAFFVINAPRAQALEQINATLLEIENRIEASMEFDGKYYVNGLPLGLSSNPYDYIKNNSEFDKLVAMGDAAINSIEECLADRSAYSGLDGYILSIALERIAKVDFKLYDEYWWQDSMSFLDSWNRAKQDVVTIVPEILNDNTLSENEKWCAVARFGTLAVEPLQEYQLSTSRVASAQSLECVNLASKIENVLLTSDIDTVLGIACGDIMPPS